MVATDGESGSSGSGSSGSGSSGSGCARSGCAPPTPPASKWGPVSEQGPSSTWRMSTAPQRPRRQVRCSALPLSTTSARVPGTPPQAGPGVQSRPVLSTRRSARPAADLRRSQIGSPSTQNSVTFISPNPPREPFIVIPGSTPGRISSIPRPWVSPSRRGSEIQLSRNQRVVDIDGGLTARDVGRHITGNASALRIADDHDRLVFTSIVVVIDRGFEVLGTTATLSS